MTESPSHHFLMIGLPGTGKTSFLAALWYMVNQSDVECALQIDRLDGDTSYLHQIRDAWLEYKSVPRNPLDSEKAVSMILKRRNSGTSLVLTIPDLSGESFRLQWSKRQLTKTYDQRLRQASGAILFVHPTVAKPHRIDSADPLIAAIAGDVAPGETADEDIPPSAVKPWDIEKAPTQVQLVELLQFILSRDYFRPPFRLAIVVSAWDLVSHYSASAEKWISSELPLLSEFLNCNKASFEVSCYGVSAQGGRYASSLFSEGNFNDPKAFAKQLSERGTPLSAWLWDQVDVNTKVALLSADHSSEGVEAMLIKSFNQLMVKTSIYSDEAFTGINLRPETKEIMKGKTVKMGEEAVRLNRLLLEDAYPNDLGRTRQYGDEALQLQKKNPGRRVLLVGSSVQNSHDITEPIQWLMQ